MKFSLAWLKEFVSLDLSTEEIIRSLTMAGVEVEGVHATGVDLNHLVVGEVVSFVRHPNADRLSVCQVNVGTETRQIVCGAKNFKAGDHVPVALPGAVLPGDFKIKESKLRGELSQGMMCSGKELGMSADADGLLILDPATTPGKPVRELFPPDVLLDLEITPNRGDLLSHRGLARELVALNLGKAVAKEGRAGQDMAACPRGVEISVEDSEACPLYTATVLEGVRVGPSPSWLVARLESIGLRSINNLVDITNLVLAELGQPMHVFDKARLSGGGPLTVRFARGGESLLALDHNDYVLQPHDLVIADGAGPVALAGVIGGENSAVTETTTTVVLEVARFSPQRVRSTARRLGLVTDSSYRFERCTDPALVREAGDRAISLILELAGGRVTGFTSVGAAAPEQRTLALRPSRVPKLLGITLSPEKIESHLSRLGAEAVERTPEQLLFRIPSWRHDLEREVDLLEELARMEGIASVPADMHLAPAPVSEADRQHDARQQLRERLAGWGFFEVLKTPLLSGPAAAVSLANPMRSDETGLRSCLRPQMLEVAAGNIHAGNSALRLFQIGRVFQADGTQVEHLALLISGAAGGVHWSGAVRDMDFFDLKGVVEALGCKGEPSAVPPAELKQAGIKQPVYYVEAPLVLDTGKEGRVFRPWSHHPASSRDIALTVPKTLPASELFAAVREAACPILEGCVLFDRFEDPTGEKLSADRVSLAISLTYRAADRTLTDKEVNAAHDSLKAHLLRKLGCEFRE
jgi:phenylalanyl-tRNA synthetase beta chain